MVVEFALDRVNERHVCNKLKGMTFPCYVWLDHERIKIVDAANVAGANVAPGACKLTTYKLLVNKLLHFIQQNIDDYFQPAVPVPPVQAPLERFVSFTRTQATERNVLTRLSRVKFPCRVWHNGDVVYVLNLEDEVGVDDWEEDGDVPDVPDDAPLVKDFRALTKMLLKLTEENLDNF